jgi:hypothetical protein
VLSDGRESGEVYRSESRSAPVLHSLSLGEWNRTSGQDLGVGTALWPMLRGQRTVPHDMSWQVLLPMVGESNIPLWAEVLYISPTLITRSFTRFAPHR